MNKPTYNELLVEIEELKKQLTDKKSLEKELKKAKILMQAAFDQSPVPLMVVTYPDFTFRIINKATEDFLLVDASNYLNKMPIEVEWTWKEYYPDDTPVASIPDLPLPMAMQGITTINKEMYIVRHDGSVVWELASASPIYDDEGLVIGGILAITDITERKKTEIILTEKEQRLKEKNDEFEAVNEELRESNEKLNVAKNKAEESDRLKTAFLQNMSHEIRTPMNAIMGFSELLMDNFENKANLEKFSEIIRLRCEDLLVIINDILDFSKIESGQLTLNAENCDLNSLFNELHSIFTEHQKSTEHTRLNFDSFNSNSNYSFKTDKLKLRQILINLIGNALKFSEEGSVTCGCKLDNNMLVFHVTDSGIGIPADKQEYIFERFSQLHQLPHKNLGGTGLGLSIVKGLTNFLGGKVWLESEVGKGSTFYFSVKYEKSGNSVIENRPGEKTNAVKNSDKTILIVEDDYYNSEFLKEVFSSYGFHIINTHLGQEAIRISLSKPVDLILMDIQLPDITGYDAIKAILEVKPHMKIIAQTAYAALDDRARALKNGCVDYISKPTKRDMIISLVNKYLTFYP